MHWVGRCLQEKRRRGRLLASAISGRHRRAAMMLKKHGAAAGHIGAIAETRAKKIASIRERWRALKGFRAVGIGASMIGSHCARPAFATESLDTRTSESSKRLMRVPPGDQGKPHSPEAILHAEEIHGLHGWNEYFGAARTPSLAAPRKHDAARCALGFAARRRVPHRAPGPPPADRHGCGWPLAAWRGPRRRCGSCRRTPWPHAARWSLGPRRCSSWPGTWRRSFRRS